MIFVCTSWDNYRRNISCLSIQIQICNKLLNCIDSDWLIDGTSGTSILTATVTNATTNSWEWILLLDQCKGISVLSLCSLLQVTLYCDMCRACTLTWCSTCLMCIHAVVVAIIGIVEFLAPFNVIRQQLLWICDFTSILLAKLLSQAGSTCRAILYASTTGNALILVNMCNICRT